ncbi:Endoribonuclease-like protein [Daphnia pulex]|uniref:Endoribonuclease-like protein n=1 Tax=Daphnia pulex TaxID=6669 RepID=E9GW08_DAPPU|nr:Endoribonuclease-like protein [Daphnia pulex]|eukprot:EFX76267.1 Endoribonuclease-like protein [Daphnia pulex]
MNAIFIFSILIACDTIGISVGQRSNGVTDDALLEISSRLYGMDVNGAYDQLELNLQTKTSSGSRVDKAPLPLFKNGIPKDVFARPTYAKLLALFDNYLASVNETEQVTPQERAEETAFFDALFGTAVIKATHQFLVSKGLAQPNVELFKEQMKNIWFGLYQRAPGKQGSSGFEHVFLGEFKNGISGLHSWVRFVTEEAKGDLNYLGYTRVLSLGKGPVGLIELPMKYQGVFKPHSTLMIGSSPELEIALYSICFMARPDSLCPIKGQVANGRSTQYSIQTFVSKFHGRQFVGSAFPTF